MGETEIKTDTETETETNSQLETRIETEKQINRGKPNKGVRNSEIRTEK